MPVNFRIADTFTDSLARLTGDEQKAVKTTAFDLQMDPANPGMQLHKLERARDRRFWSVRVSRDIRLIVHRTEASLLLCYVDHHDKAYHWAERRKLETHPTTGAAQIVEIRERVQQVVVPEYVTPEPRGLTRQALFASVADGDLLAWGVPKEWLGDVHAVDSEDALLTLADHLPAEAAEALLEVATGGVPVAQTAVSLASEQAQMSLDMEDVALSACVPLQANTNPFDHPDAQRRFRTIHDVDELERALDAPWDKWTIFLHPAQREWVEKDWNGPARVSGSAGTGKTIVALHRAVRMAREHADARVLLTTFSDPLASALRVKLRRLIGHQPRLGERIDVLALGAVGERLYEAAFGSLHRVSADQVSQLLDAAAAKHPGHGFSSAFLHSEWQHVVDAWQLDTWEAYRDVRRLGRKTRLPESRRELLWHIFSDVRAMLDDKAGMTHAGMFARLARDLPTRRQPPYDYVVVDEAQDVSVSQLRFLAAMGRNRPEALFFSGDLGQRIFRQPFSWKSLGVDIRGRSRTLHVNYRTSHQIRMRADRLLDPVVADVDGNEEERKGTVSVFNGPVPSVRVFDAPASEVEAVGRWLRQCADEGVAVQEMAVFVRSESELDRARDAVSVSGLAVQVLDKAMNIVPGQVPVSTMHLAKGLEFRAVAVMACDEDVIPSETRIEAVSDDADLEEVYNTERHLLYVACTRARDHLHVSAVRPTSEFLEDLAATDAV